MTEGRSLVRHSAGNSSCQRQKQLFMSGFCTGGCPGQRFHCFFFFFFFQGSGHCVSCSMCMQVCIYTVMVLMMTCLSVLTLKLFDVFPVQVFTSGFVFLVFLGLLWC